MPANDRPSQLEAFNATPAGGVAAGLHWVRLELVENLQLASQLVEQHAENRQNEAVLNKAHGHLHEVRGAAVLIQAYGLALLAEEMKQTVHELATGAVHDADPAYSAIVGACVQAVDYLDLLQQGQTDSALVLQPIVNELRLARGKTLLTEDDLFVAQFRVLGLHLDRAAFAQSTADIQAESARLHPVFSASLLAWFKDQDAAQALSRIGRVAELLADASHERSLHQLWRTAAACVEALLSRALDDSLELKRQFGRAGQLMKILAESGEAAAVKQMSDVSLRLLFYAGRSRGTGPRVGALRQGLNLETWLPTPDAVNACRARLRGANTGLLVKVAEELRADLAEVRDSIDVALRAGASKEEFESTAQRLKRVADTLLVLGLTAESQALAQPLETLRDAGPADTAAWMEFATAVLQVDLSLEAALYRQLQAVPGKAAPAKPASIDLRLGTAALLRESLVNLARVKGHVEAYIKSGEASGLPEAARLLDEIAAGFRMLALDRAENLALEVRRFLQSPEFAAVRSDNTASGRFADTVAALEYYLELHRERSPGTEQVLDQLGGLVARLYETSVAAADAHEPEPELAAPAIDSVFTAVADTPAPAEAAEAAPSFELSLVDYVAPAASAPVAEPPPPIPSEEFHLVGEPLPEVPEAAPASATAAAADAPLELPAEAPVAAEAAAPAIVERVATAVAPSADASAPAGETDPEIREIFIDEAAEVLETLQRTLPRWLRQPDDRDALSTIRRGFHTLKGSGRMVGARDIGEFAWAIENMLNRCLDRTIEQSQAVQDTVREAIGLMPALIAAFRTTAATQPEAAPRLAENARRLAAGETLGEDDELISVFRSDALARLQMVTRWVEDQVRGVGEYGTPESVVRAFHTLRGAARAIDALPIGELAEKLEDFLESQHRARAPLSDEGLALVGDCCKTLTQWIGLLGSPAAANIDAQPWLARVDALMGGAEAPSAASAQAQQAADTFTFEALDLVQGFESELGAWAQAPQAGAHLEALKAASHNLKSAAERAQCAPIAAVAQVLQLKLGSMVAGAAPSAAFFEAGRKVVECLYTQLDQYRDGTLSADGGEWMSLVAALDEAPAAATPAPAPAAAAPLDAELVEIFLHEGEELAEEAERLAPAVAAQPDDAQLLGAWQRALHTLKGSARVAGLEGIGELAHRLETATEHARHADASERLRFGAQLRVALDGLHELLDAARAGRNASPAAILSRFDAVPAPMPAPAAEGPSVEAPAAAPEPEAPAAAEPVAEVAAESADESVAESVVDAPDPELLDIFQHEASELLESLGNSLANWQEQPARYAELSREMQRDLHTFKGGARMAGLNRVGAAAHRLETALVQLERGGGADSAALGRIANELDDLHRLYDACTLLRAAPVVEPPPQPYAPTIAEPEPALIAPEPVLEFAAPALPEPEPVPVVEPLPEIEPLPEVDALPEPEAIADLADLAALASEPPSEPAIELSAETFALPDIDSLPDLVPEPEAVAPVAAFVPEPQTAPIAESVAEPVVEPLAESLIEPIAEPVIEAMAEPAVERIAAQAPPARVETAAASAWNAELLWKPVDEASTSEARREAVRVPVERLDGMLNQAGEISIYRSRLEENHSTLVSSLAEMAQTITRVREQLRLMEVETEAQIAARGFAARNEDDGHRYESEFDPLEMDRYSRMQELSRALAESVSDMTSLHATLDNSASEAEGLLHQQGRINTEVQQALMGTLMVPFSRQVQRLSRVVRQTAEQNGKRARTEFSGAESELDRNVLERMTAPLEHLLRNCVVHGIEPAAAREAAGKPAEGVVHVALKREGSQLLIEVSDDGRGLDFEAIRAQAVKKGLMRAEAQVSDEDLARFVFAPGFSTAKQLTQDAGRGIGMDVVAAEVKQLGGTVDIASETGKGIRFRIRLPLMLAVSQALVVQVGEELFAIPLGAVEGIARAPREALPDMFADNGRPLQYGGREYQVRRLGELVGLPAPARIDSRTVPAILMRIDGGIGGGERRIAVVAERLIGNREIVTKPAGPVLGSIAGLSGATILADGRVMLIVDVPALIAEATRRRLGDEAAATPAPAVEATQLIMVVDDSITIRRVTERLLVRKGYRVITAKDGLDAMAMLQTEAPDAVLLDIEMPRADGFEVAAFIRNTPRTAQLPIIMITSRSGDKHREHARSLGVNQYLIKPYQDDQLLAELRAVLAAPEAVNA